MEQNYQQYTPEQIQQYYAYLQYQQQQLQQQQQLLEAQQKQAQTPTFDASYFQLFQNSQQINNNNNDPNNNPIRNNGKANFEIIIKIPPVLVAENQGLSLYQFIMTRHPPAWEDFFQGAQKDIAHACQKIEEESGANGRAFFPHIPRVLAAFWLTSPLMLKAVIIGQDPYPGTTKAGLPKANGMCFGSDVGNEIPDSLITVYEELQRSVENWKHPGHPDLRCWGREGVLLLNSALTVEVGRAGSHLGFWKPFTNRLMDYINDNCTNVVFMLWGKKAQKIADSIYASKHHKLTAYHPSPMSRNQGFDFVGCNHFNLANFYLAENGIRPINWQVK